MRKKIIASFLCVLFLVPVAAAPAFATAGDALDYQIADWWAALTWDLNNVDTGFDFYRNYYSAFFKSGESAESSYSNYVSALQGDLGSTTLANGGVRLYFPVKSYSSSQATIGSSGLVGAPSAFASFTCLYDTGSVRVSYSSVKAPFQCNYSCFYSYVADNCSRVFFDGTLPSSYSAAAGSTIYLTLPTQQWDDISFMHTKDSSNMNCSFQVTAYVDCIPYSGTVSDLTECNVTENSRPSVLRAPIGYYDDSGNLIAVENVVVFDEDTMTFYNPVTGNSYTVSAWVYDYATRTYTLTLSDGSVVSVAYGDEALTIVQGGQTYTLKYLIPNSSSGGDSGGSSSGGDSGGGTGTDIVDVTGIKDFWDKFKAKIPFVDDLKSFASDLVNVVQNPDSALVESGGYYALSLNVDLGNFGGGFTGPGKYGDDVIPLLPIDSFNRYKPMWDDIVVGFAWLVFLWNVYGQIPNIIHGGSSALQSTAGISNWSNSGPSYTDLQVPGLKRREDD